MTKKTKPPVTFPPDKPFRNSLLYQPDEYWRKALCKAVSKRRKEQEDRLAILAHHYGIEADNLHDLTFELALTMARELYPEPKQPGGKKKWDAAQIGCLVVEMERLIKPRSKTYGISYAAARLAKSEPWKSFVKGKDIAEMLRTTYTKYRAGTWAESMRKTYQYMVEIGKEKEWDQSLVETVNYCPDQ